MSNGRTRREGYTRAGVGAGTMGAPTKTPGPYDFLTVENLRRNALGLRPMTPEEIRGYFDPTYIRNLYRILAANLGQQQQSAAARAAMRGSAMAGAGGFANPLAYQSAVMGNVYGSFAPQFGGLSAQEGGALVDNQRDLFRAIYGNELAGLGNSLAQAGLKRDVYQMLINKYLGEKEIRAQQQQRQAGTFDYLSLLV